MLSACDRKALDKVRTLATGDRVRNSAEGFLKRLSRAYSGQAAADPDDPPPQLHLFEIDEELAAVKELQLERLWPLREWLLRDLETLLHVTPRLADIVFGSFRREEWPHNFIAGRLSPDSRN